MKKKHIHIHFHDSDFKESEHPRAENGQFGSGSGRASMNPGHERLVEPKKILKETEKAYGISNPAYEEAREAKDPSEMSRAAREAFQNRESLIWLPKSHTSAHEGHVVGASPWLASTHFETEENQERRATKSVARSEGSGVKAAGHETPSNSPQPTENRHYLKVPFAKKEIAKRAGAKWDPDKKAWYWPKEAGEMPMHLNHFNP